MPKHGSNDLFRLIKSLSKTEKAYFKKFAERHVIGERNNYLKLFDAIDRQEVYDEKKLLREEKYVKQLPYLKNYLMSAILKSMQVFHAELTEEDQQRRMMEDARFFYKKGLYDLSAKITAKTRATASSRLIPTTFIDAVRLDERIITTTQDMELWKAHLAGTLPEERELLEDLLLYNELTGYFLEISRRVRSNDFTQLGKLRKALEAPVLALLPKAKSFRCRTRALSALVMFHSLSGDYGRFYEYNKQLVGLYRTAVDYCRENPDQYLRALNNLCVACMTLKKFREGLKIIAEIRSIRPTQPDEERRIFLTAVNAELMLHLEAGNFEKTAELFEQHQEKLQEHLFTAFVQRYFILCGIGIEANHYAGRYKAALRLIAHTLSYTELNQFPWIKRAYEIYQIMVLHDMGSETATFIRNLRRRSHAPIFDPYETILLDYLEKSAEADEKKRRQLAEEAHRQVLRLKKDRIFYRLSSYIKLPAWLKSKATGEPFRESLKATGWGMKMK